MEDFLLSDGERLQIFKVLCEHSKLSFNRIVKLTSIPSNKLSYQLNVMKEKGFVLKEGADYSISIDAQRLIPYFSQVFKKEVGVLPVVLGIVRNKERILLIQRKKMPYKGYWGLFGGKQICGETIPQTIEREVFEEAGLQAKFLRCNAVVSEQLKQDDRFKHAFLFILTSLEASSDEIQEKEEGKVAWFDYEDVIQNRLSNLIPSDVEFLKKYDCKTLEIDHVIMEEQGDTLILR